MMHLEHDQSEALMLKLEQIVITLLELWQFQVFNESKLVQFRIGMYIHLNGSARYEKMLCSIYQMNNAIFLISLILPDGPKMWNNC